MNICEDLCKRDTAGHCISCVDAAHVLLLNPNTCEEVTKIVDNCVKYNADGKCTECLNSFKSCSVFSKTNEYLCDNPYTTKSDNCGPGINIWYILDAVK